MFGQSVHPDAPRAPVAASDLGTDEAEDLLHMQVAPGAVLGASDLGTGAAEDSVHLQVRPGAPGAVLAASDIGTGAVEDSMHLQVASGPIATPDHATSDDEDFMHLQEQQHLASELARLFVPHESGAEDAPLTHADIRAWLQELLPAGAAGVGES